MTVVGVLLIDPIFNRRSIYLKRIHVILYIKQLFNFLTTINCKSFFFYLQMNRDTPKMGLHCPI